MAALDVIGLDVVLVWFRLWVCFLGFFFLGGCVCLFVANSLLCLYCFLYLEKIFQHSKTLKLYSKVFSQIQGPFSLPSSEFLLGKGSLQPQLRKLSSMFKLPLVK